MPVLAFILAVVAVALFVAEAVQRRSLVAWGLAALTVAWIITATLVEGSRITF